MSARAIVSALTFVSLVACAKPADLGPARADLEARVTAECVDPPARPAYATASKARSRQEIEAALIHLCENYDVDKNPCEAKAPLNPTCRARVADSRDALAVVHDGLASDRAIVGDLRRNRLLLSRGVDLTNPSAVESATNAGAEGATAHCAPDSAGVTRLLRASIIDLHSYDEDAKALDGCADAIGLFRDAVLAGNVSDVLIASAHMEGTLPTCDEIARVASPAAVQTFATSLDTIRRSMPATLDAVFTRDSNEVTLRTFGPLFDRTKPIACERARLLIEAGDAKLSQRDVNALEQLWRTARDTDAGDAAKYLAPYKSTLEKIDALAATAHAHAASTP